MSRFEADYEIKLLVVTSEKREIKRTFKTSKKFYLFIVFQQFMKTDESYFFHNP
jgi:hypothetical protein